MKTKRCISLNQFLKVNVRAQYPSSIPLSECINDSILSIPSQVFDKIGYNFDDTKASKSYERTMSCFYSIFSKNQTNNNTTNINKNKSFTINLNPLVCYYIDKFVKLWNKGRNRVNESNVFNILLSIAYLYKIYPEGLLKKLKIRKIKLPVINKVLGTKNNGKMQKAVNDLGKQIPDNITSVSEMFAGSCGISYNLLSCFTGKNIEYSLNDIDKEKINLYLCIRDKYIETISECIEIVEQLRNTDDEAQFFNHIKDNINKHLQTVSIKCIDNELAAMYMYINAVSVWNKNDNLSGGTIKDHINKFMKRIRDIPAAHKMLENVNLSNKEYYDLLENNVKNTFLILDPPYLFTTGYGNSEGDFSFEMTDHEKIAKYVRGLDSSNIITLFCRYTITNHSLGYTDEDLRGFYKYHYGYLAKEEGKTFYQKIIEINEVEEVIISNYKFSGFEEIIPEV